jgi:uncharacterized OsmC-like protein
MLDQAEPRQVHRHLRALYGERPEEAISSKWARTSSSRVPAGDPVHGEVEVGRGYGTSLAYALDEKVGGLGDAPNPGDLLCAALAACEDGTIRMVAGLLGVELEELEVEVSGDLDVRGTLGIDPAVRVGFEELECSVTIRPAPGADPRAVGRLLAAAERFCVNLDSLTKGLRVTSLRSDASLGPEKGRGLRPLSARGDRQGPR